MLEGGIDKIDELVYEIAFIYDCAFDLCIIFRKLYMTKQDSVGRRD